MSTVSDSNRAPDMRTARPPTSADKDKVIPISTSMSLGDTLESINGISNNHYDNPQDRDAEAMYANDDFSV